LIAIDTVVLVLALRPDDPNDPRAAQAAALLASLDQQETILIPAPVLTEFLYKYTPDKRGAVLAELGTWAVIQAFDAKAAAIAANLNPPPAAERNEPRQCVKTDVFIIATAIAHGASCIYTDNIKDFRAIAQNLIDVRTLPEYQPELPFES
jgi:predicted nucleic acid-binding protein